MPKSVSAKIPCPYCQNPISEVKDTRPQGNTVRRRRECDRCGRRFTTVEHIASHRRKATSQYDHNI
jgi:transcriptional repressor NrdR